MKYNNMAEQAEKLFSGTVLLKNYYSSRDYYNTEELYYDEVSRCQVGEVLQDMEEPYQVYAVELRTDYQFNRAEYEAAGVFYSAMLGAYVWPVFAIGTPWSSAEPQNIFTDWDE